MTKTTYGRPIMFGDRLIARSMEVPEGINGCVCTIRIEFEIDGRKHTANERQVYTTWDIVQQGHDNPGWRHYLECHGCGYQYARNYWKHNHLNDVEIAK